MNFFLLLLIKLFLIQTIENIENKERIEGAMKLAISSLELIPTNNDTIILKYPKYKIALTNFRLMSPELSNTSLNNVTYKLENDCYIYGFENLKFILIYDIKIIHNSEFYLEEKDNFIDFTCQYINFKYNLKTKLLNFDSFNIFEYNFNIELDNGIFPLEFYDDTKEGKQCLCKHESDKEYIKEYPHIYIKQFIKLLMNYYISEVEKKNILMIYDMKKILANSLKLIKTTNVTNDTDSIDTIKMKKIFISFDEIEALNQEDPLLIIHQLKFFGSFNLSAFNQEYEFDFELIKKKNNGIELHGQNLNFNFDKILIDIYSDFNDKNQTKIYKYFKYAILTDYSEALRKSNMDYYNLTYN